jgi:predicted methyltransferase
MEVSEIQQRLYKTTTMDCYQIYHQHTDSYNNTAFSSDKYYRLVFITLQLVMVHETLM